MELLAIGEQLSFPEEVRFKYTWRKYQQRVLDELDEHLEDDHLHVIAPPGSGKTVLGLEVMLRLNKPTLIFAPTIAIRDQWVQRFCELFLQANRKPIWISKDIKSPAFLTVSTYQALHSAIKGEDSSSGEFEEVSDKAKKEEKSRGDMLVKRLKDIGVGTFVVDEAHHLKNAWWESLDRVKEILKPTVVGLTATPPYDVSPLEWQRYIGLNGPVDAEISVPELVAEGNLCPHQDMVYLSTPTNLESQKIFTYRKRVQAIYADTCQDPVLLSAMLRHPAYQDPENNLEWIYANLSKYSALLIFLQNSGQEIPELHLDVIGDKNLTVPEMDFNWMGQLLSFYLFYDVENFVDYEEHQLKLIQKLKQAGVLEKRRVDFWHSDKINSYLSSSLSKLNSIGEIVDFEYGQLGSGLRMVILTDYIRKEYMVNDAVNEQELNKIGVLPIFEKIRRSKGGQIKMAVLTGSLIIIPSAALKPVKEVARIIGLDDLSSSSLSYDRNYMIISAPDHSKHGLVRVITDVFQQGHIELIVGTKSLLGEGWDAPAINSLILASFVGSYVLSNQMRGRAIRKGVQNQNKTSNIWHLACYDLTANDGGDDFQILQRRFKTFVGLGCREELSIENGIGRLDFPERINCFEEMEGLNKKTFQLAKDRHQLQEKWIKALEEGTLLVEEIKVPLPKDQDYRRSKSMYYNRTIKNFSGLLGSGLFGFGIEAIMGMGKASRYIWNKQDLIYCFMALGLVGMIIFGRLTYKTFRMYVKFRDIAKDFQQIARALLNALVKVGVIHSDLSELRIEVRVDRSGCVYCHLEGGTTYEKSVFIKSLQEVVALVDNPRYLIIRKSFFLKMIAQKDYHAVPEILGRNKESAEYFKEEWQQQVGNCELCYTRTIEGRKLLLLSRMQSLAAEFENKAERVKLWR